MTYILLWMAVGGALGYIVGVIQVITMAHLDHKMHARRIKDVSRIN